ncbi:MAG: aminotransferase class V-fold PLP-dependent enzyme [Caldilineaceae bacterium]|nr:aminotransferase class V-fold PLP-dependent enzyme [Caldilineaceae bacterium]
MNATPSAPHPGRHFLQIPGPTNLPERVARALSRSTIDHRGPEFAQLTLSILERLQTVFQTTQPVLIYPSSATGCWEAALVNTFSSGDKVLFCDNGHFAARWTDVATKLGLTVERLQGDWRHGVDSAAVEATLADDTVGAIKAVAMVHNETSTGVANDVAAVRQAIDRANHNALFMVDVVSSIGAMEYHHDAWGVDVTVAGSQKGLMLPPGLGFNVISEKALAAAKTATLPKSYWDWQPVIEFNQRGVFPYTPATNLFYGLDEALAMLLEEGLDQVFARHQRLAAATRAAVQGWGLEIFCQDSQLYSPTLTAVLMPAGHDADALRSLILDRFNMSLGTGLGQIKGKVFRIGHLGDFNELMLAGTLCGVEMGLALAGVPHTKGGTQKALDYLVQESDN